MKDFYSSIWADDGEANVLANIRGDLKTLRKSRWAETHGAGDKRRLRRQIRRSIAKVRAYRARRSVV